MGNRGEMEGKYNYLSFFKKRIINMIVFVKKMVHLIHLILSYTMLHRLKKPLNIKSDLSLLSFMDQAADIKTIKHDAW